MSKARSKYGRAVLGDAEYERQKAKQKETRGIYGPAVTGKPKGGARPAELQSGDAEKTDAQLSVKELEKLLAKSPAVLDRQIEAEYQREEGPRKTAIRLFIDTEKKRDPTPRPQVILFLERSLQGEGS